MMQFVELCNRVFRVEITPDTPGRCRRSLTVMQESGSCPTREEWETLAKELVEHMRDLGWTNIDWHLLAKEYPDE